MSVLLWLVQILLALAFLAHGWMLLFPPASLVEAMNSTMSTGFRLFLGTAEVLAAIGLTLPGMTRIMPGFVPLAAVGIMIVMISATVFHISRNEISGAITTFVLLLLATFVAYGRWKVKPIPSRTTATVRM
jgi:uncharacterized membrane protein YphA (DoxX/SURF4 family)